MAALLESLRMLWRGLRTVTGDDAYERYLERHRRCQTHAHVPPLDRKAFQQAEVGRRWSGVRRCC